MKSVFQAQGRVRNSSNLLKIFGSHQDDYQRRQIQFCSVIMALSKWEYVKVFESEEKLLPNCWAIARLDGRGLFYAKLT